jgi:hypothetical protein
MRSLTTTGANLRQTAMTTKENSPSRLPQYRSQCKRLELTSFNNKRNLELAPWLKKSKVDFPTIGLLKKEMLKVGLWHEMLKKFLQIMKGCVCCEYSFLKALLSFSKTIQVKSAHRAWDSSNWYDTSICWRLDGNLHRKLSGNLDFWKSNTKYIQCTASALCFHFQFRESGSYTIKTGCFCLKLAHLPIRWLPVISGIRVKCLFQLE